MSKQISKTKELTLFPLDKLKVIKVHNQKSIEKLKTKILTKILELELVNEMINNYNKINDYDN